MGVKYAMLLSNRMNYLKDEDPKELLWAPYAFEKFDVEDIKKRMDCLVPDNMYIIMHSG